MFIIFQYNIYVQNDSDNNSESSQWMFRLGLTRFNIRTEVQFPHLLCVIKTLLAWPKPLQPGRGQCGSSCLQSFQEKADPFTELSFCSLVAMGQLPALRCDVYFPDTWPWPSQPATGHLVHENQIYTYYRINNKTMHTHFTEDNVHPAKDIFTVHEHSASIKTPPPPQQMISECRIINIRRSN